MDKRDLIINAALKLFVAHGFHGTATSKIAQEAGVANGTLFQYFKTKDELVMALYIQFKAELAQYVETNTAAQASFKEGIKTQVLASLYWALDHPTKFHFIQQFHASPYIGQVDQEVIQQQNAPHMALIQQGIDQGIIKQLPVALLYAFLTSHIFGLYQYLTSQPLTQTQQHTIIETTFELLWDMIS